MSLPRLLDLFSGAGGCAAGYQRAGFYVVGVDKEPQPHYCGDEFVRADALEFVRAHGHEFDAIHASPPCQRYSVETPAAYRENHPDLIDPVRRALQEIGRPYAIENVENARSLLINPVLLCGSMFGLPLWRHRYFELWPSRLILTPPCNHSFKPVLITGTAKRQGKKIEYTAQQCRDASGIDWMTRKELDQAIPPAYCEFIGAQIMTALSFPA